MHNSIKLNKTKQLNIIYTINKS